MRRQFGLVFQQFDLFPHYTVLKNVCDAPISVQKRDKAEVEAEAMALLDKMGLQGKENAYPYQLSGGQQQRVAIARTLMQRARILIFDDSMSAVDTETDAAIRRALHGMRHDGVTFIISHRITTLCEADRILVLDEGRLVQEGTHDALMVQEGLYRRIASIQDMQAEGGGAA